MNGVSGRNERSELATRSLKAERKRAGEPARRAERVGTEEFSSVSPS